ncbi:PEP-CTERM sorting domain-containing protein [Mariniblastus fucicola]|uniref:PEP-CTERM protein-sorting domain-containing protein n=1 Tax=Mariniblastus fucicola TaxID=980251 RepID=A0A5B9PFV4_9BACT|nr:PEP-CTERM sorting domain-containing protein [Mariniblastus fucicola]QEG25204.1 hypothetical protein MFFC18_51280 [Mariniblastus fucicola]
MFQTQRLTVLSIAFCLGVCLALFPTPAFADVVHSIGVQGTGSGNGTLPYSESIDVLAGGTLTGNGSGDGNGVTTGSSFGQIFAPNSGGQLASLSNSVFSDRAGSFVPNAVAGSAVVYGDDIFLTGSGTLPSSIRVHFAASGSLNTSSISTSSPFSTSRALFYARGTSFAGFFSNMETDNLAGQENPDLDAQLAFLDYRQSFDDFPDEQSLKTVSESWSSLSDDGSTFNGTFSHDVSYDNAIGGYDFEVVFAAISRAGDSIASTSVAIDLVGVTDTSNNVISDFDVSFASGRLSAVPEPSTGLLCVVLLGAALCRRKRSVLKVA